MSNKFFILPFFVFLLACASGTQDITLSEQADNSTQTGDGGAYYPNTSGNDNVCELDAEGNCVDSTEGTETVQLSTTSLDFGTNEIGAIECQGIAIPSGLAYSAEIDKENTSAVDGVSQFALLDGTGAYSQSRVEGAAEVTVCYLRSAIGAHTGQIKLVINAAATSGSVYAYVITAKGSTVESFFTITSPTDGQIISSQSNAGIDDVEGDYLVAATGVVNLNLVSILKGGASADIIIDAGGVKYKANFDGSGNFAATIGLSQTPGVYEVKFSVETIRDYTIEKAVTVIVATAPTLSIEVRDNGGAGIGTAVPTDATELIVGFAVENLMVSGPAAGSMTVVLTEMQMNGETTLREDTEIYYGQEGLCVDENGDVFSGFASATTLCVALSHITGLKAGINTITGKAANSLGETLATFTLIIDNSKPTIAIEQPLENQRFDPVTGTTSFTVEGVVKNFAPHDLDTAPATQGSDEGSSCQPDSQDDSACPESGVKLWVNVSLDDSNLPLHIFPDLSSYGSPSLQDLYNELAAGEDTAGNCLFDDAGTPTCNIPEAPFKLTLTIPSTEHGVVLNGFGPNIAQFQAESLSGHRTIEVITFVQGLVREQSKSRFGGTKGILTSSIKTYLGAADTGCPTTDTSCVFRAPVMLNLSSGLFDRDTLEGEKIIRAVEYVLNENLKFADLANGWPLPENEDGEIDLLTKFRAQYKEEMGEDFDYVWNLDEGWQEKFIWQGLHKLSMAEKNLALLNYRMYLIDHGDCDVQTNNLCFFENEGDQFDEKEGFAVARDACMNEITTAFVPLGDIYHINKAFSGVTSTIIYEREWPAIAGTDTAFNDFTQGKWHVDKLALKDNGYIDADLCLIPEDVDVETCSDDVSHALTPAFWGHFVSYNLIEGGATQGTGVDDPTMPLVWSVGKVRLKLNDIVKISHLDFGDGKWSNYVDLNLSPGYDVEGTYFPENTSEKVDVNIWDISENHDNDSIIIEPFGNCDRYYEDLYNAYREKYLQSSVEIPEFSEDIIPYGCNPDYSDGLANYPFVLDRTSTAGQELINDLDDPRFLLQTVWQSVNDTFKKMIGCMDTEMLNPLINDKKFPYPPWVDEGAVVSLEFSWEDYTFGVNLKNADLVVNEKGLTARLPLEASVSGVMSRNLLRATENATDKANTQGFTVRSLENTGLENYPLTSEAPLESAFAGVSLSIEELVNSLTYLIFKKGPFTLLETFDVEELEVNNNWSLGIDKVILGRLDICDLAGILPTDFAPTLWFTSISSSLTEESTLHLDVILDKNYPPMLFLSPLEAGDGAEAVQVNLSLTNVQVAVKELIAAYDDNGEIIANVYEAPATQPELLRLRLDAILSLKLVYYKELRQIYVYLDVYEDQNVHVSVPDGHGGVSYDDVNVVIDVLNGVIGPAIDKFGSVFTTDLAEATPTFIMTLAGSEDGSLSVADLMDSEFELLAEGAENKSCGDNVPYYEDELAEREFTIKGRELSQKVYSPFVGEGQGEGWRNVTQSRTISAPFFNSCDLLFGGLTKNEDGEWEKTDDPIAEALCDFGVKDIKLTPNIIFDTDTGYVHISADAEVELYDWVP